jgi:uncharacterized membrane protein YvbJ
MTMDSSVHELKLNGNKLKIQLRDVVWFVSTFIAVVSIYLAGQSRTDRNTDAIVNNLNTANEDRKRLWTTINYMNENGTNHSHLVDEKQQQTIDLLSAQFADVTRQLRDLLPKVDKIDTNVLWLMSREVERKSQPDRK